MISTRLPLLLLIAGTAAWMVGIRFDYPLHLIAAPLLLVAVVIAWMRLVRSKCPSTPFVLIPTLLPLIGFPLFCLFSLIKAMMPPVWWLETGGEMVGLALTGVSVMIMHYLAWRHQSYPAGETQVA